MMTATAGTTFAYVKHLCLPLYNHESPSANEAEAFYWWCFRVTGSESSVHIFTEALLGERKVFLRKTLNIWKASLIQTNKQRGTEAPFFSPLPSSHCQVTKGRKISLYFKKNNNNGGGSGEEGSMENKIKLSPWL